MIGMEITVRENDDNVVVRAVRPVLRALCYGSQNLLSHVVKEIIMYYFLPIRNTVKSVCIIDNFLTYNIIYLYEMDRN